MKKYKNYTNKSKTDFRHNFQLWTTSITLWFHVINITIIFKTHYATCNNNNVAITGNVPYFFVLGDPFKHAFEQDAILKSQGPQKYAFLNENDGKVEFKRLHNGGRVNSSHSNIVRDLKGSNSQQTFLNSQEEEDTSQKVFIFDTGNHTDRHGFIQVDRKKKNVSPEVLKKTGTGKIAVKDKKQKNVKNNTRDSNTNLVASSNWSYGLKNGLKNSNRLIWVSSNKDTTSNHRNNSNNPFLNKDEYNNNTRQKPDNEAPKNIRHNKIIKKKKKNANPRTKFVLFANENPTITTSSRKPASLRPSTTQSSGASVSSRYKNITKKDTKAITPRSGFDTGMSFSFSSFGDENIGSSLVTQKQFSPTRIPSFSSRKRTKPTKIGPLNLHEYGTPTGTWKTKYEKRNDTYINPKPIQYFSTPKPEIIYPSDNIFQDKFLPDSSTGKKSKTANHKTNVETNEFWGTHSSNIDLSEELSKEKKFEDVRREKHSATDTTNFTIIIEAEERKHKAVKEPKKTNVPTSILQTTLTPKNSQNKGILEFITRPSKAKNPKRKRKIIVVKKAPVNGPSTSDLDNREARNQRGSKVFVKRVKKLREPRKAQSSNTNKFLTPSFFDNIRKQLVFKASGQFVVEGSGCLNKEYGYYADPDDPTKYFVCLPYTKQRQGKSLGSRLGLGRKWDFTCGPGTTFSEKHLTCV